MAADLPEILTAKNKMVTSGLLIEEAAKDGKNIFWHEIVRPLWKDGPKLPKSNISWVSK